MKTIPPIAKLGPTAAPSRRTGGAAGGEPDSGRLELGVNRERFALLVGVHAFVSAIVGIERVLRPLLAEREFDIASKAFSPAASPRDGPKEYAGDRVAVHRADGCGDSVCIGVGLGSAGESVAGIN